MKMSKLINKSSRVQAMEELHLTSHVTYVTNVTKNMSRSSSGKVVAILDVSLKADLHSALAKEGLSFKQWVTMQAKNFINERMQYSKHQMPTVGLRDQGETK